jgi:hypothetical protein
MVKVKIIKTVGNSTLVEFDWAQGIKRRFVPTSFVHDNLDGAASQGYCEIDDEVLDAGIEYGDDFLEILQQNIDCESVSNALHQRGIWSFGDVGVNPDAVKAAFYSILDEQVRQFSKDAKSRYEVRKEMRK